MEKFGSLFISLGFSVMVLTSYSQESQQIRIFLEKVEKDLREVDSTARIQTYRRSISNRKVITKGWLGKDNKSFKQKIKYSRNGLKKEKLKIYLETQYNSIVVMYLIKINDKIHFLKYYDTVRDNKYDIVKRSKEILIDNRLYQKTYYPNSGVRNRTENSVILTLNK
jgi:hypothetical protein